MKIFNTVKKAVEKKSPEILIAFGIAGMITTTVLAVKATPKAMEKIKEVEKNKKEEFDRDHGYSELDTMFKLTKPEVVKATWKCYIPAAISGATSIACIVGANTVHSKRNAAIATAYKLSEKALTEYKEATIEEVVKENKNKKSPAYGKWYAYPVVEETMNLAALAKHMEEHNTGFSEAMCLGMMTAMVKCIKEQLLAGKNVKIDNLAIFSVGIRNKEGAKTEADFSVANNIGSVKLRARATGILSNANLNSVASVRRASSVVGGTTIPSGGDSTSGGSTTTNPGDGLE